MAKGNGGIFHNGNHGAEPNMNTDKEGTSAAQGTSVGSGSRPVKSMHPIESGSAADTKTQGRENSKDPAHLK